MAAAATCCGALAASAFGGATASTTGFGLELRGTGGADHVGVSLDPGTGDLVVTVMEPETITAPGDPACVQDGPRRFQCQAGHFVAVFGGLGGGNDVFRATDGLNVYIGAVLDGKVRNLNGGPGADQLKGGAAGDGLAGNDGNDWIRGGRGRDVLRGNAGRDRLDGGLARDACVGGSGSDLFRSCETGSQ